jgi:beta-mannosidase
MEKTMQKLDLAGKWKLQEAGSSASMDGALPGCNYLDLMANGRIPDPFWGTNEAQAKEIAEKDFEYSRQFEAPPGLLEQDQVELVIAGLDTLATIWLNENQIAETDNAYRTFRFPVKDLLKAGENSLRMLFKGTRPYLRKMQDQESLPSMDFGVKGVYHLRKPACHFGWDWGPNLPPAGISGSIGLEAYRLARLGEVRLKQAHSAGQVTLHVQVALDTVQEGRASGLSAVCRVTAPDGRVFESSLSLAGQSAQGSLQIEGPQLWWSNGLGEQPLYSVRVALIEGGQVLDAWEKKIGLRTIRLDTSPDRWGRNFQFQVNGVPVFAKGADWIPSDSFVTRTSAQDLEFYIRSAKEANMNMLRVWGGGYYESDRFYDLCDQYGILVWQDFGFACNPYPFYNQAFRESVKQEVFDNVQRLRHHASLALWCGNNEVEIMSFLWRKNKKLVQSMNTFFHTTLAEWVAQADETTPYWPGSPSSGIPNGKPNDVNRGDTHLWQVWHGMLPIEAFRKWPTRFCSEFGMESLPSMHTIRTFTDEPDIDIFHPVMLAHQKSGGGNQKMLFYLLSKYRNPGSLEDFIYLSQLIQSETVRCATEQWRRQTGRCNGALYWQYNDCWPVASWAGIDYGKQFKAVQYRARQFNQMVCISADLYRDRADLYVINDHPSAFAGTIHWEIADFHGKTITSGEVVAEVGANKAEKILSLKFQAILGGSRKSEVALVLSLLANGEPISRQTCLLVPDKEAALQKPSIRTELRVEGDSATLSLHSDVFARFVQVEIEGVHTPLSDNYFDIEGGKSHTIRFAVPENMDATALERAIHIRSLIDVRPRGSRLHDRYLRLAMWLNKQNLLTWFFMKFA